MYVQAKIFVTSMLMYWNRRKHTLIYEVFTATTHLWCDVIVDTTDNRHSLQSSYLDSTDIIHLIALSQNQVTTLLPQQRLHLNSCLTTTLNLSECNIDLRGCGWVYSLLFAIEGWHFLREVINKNFNHNKLWLSQEYASEMYRNWKYEYHQV